MSSIDDLLTDLEAKAKVVDMKSMGSESSIAYIIACEPIVIISLIATLRRYRSALEKISSVWASKVVAEYDHKALIDVALCMIGESKRALQEPSQGEGE